MLKKFRCCSQCCTCTCLGETKSSIPGDCCSGCWATTFGDSGDPGVAVPACQQILSNLRAIQERYHDGNTLRWRRRCGCSASPGHLQVRREQRDRRVLQLSHEQVSEACLTLLRPLFSMPYRPGLLASPTPCLRGVNITEPSSKSDLVVHCGCS